MSEKALQVSATLIDAARSIEASKRMVVVTSEDNHVLGTLTDGDIRRSILKGRSLQVSVVDAMNSSPVTAPVNTSNDLLRKLLKKHNIRALPLVDKQRKFVRIIDELELVGNDDPLEDSMFSAAIIMAGGEGKRLLPITEKLPKPMVEIDGVPLLERQIHRLRNFGFTKVYISVNYLGEVIKNHFGNGEKFEVDIRYLNESKKLGTAGALFLVQDLDDPKPFLVMNGDILTKSDFVNIFHFHEDHQSDITISAVDYHIEIPFGVIQYEGVKVKALLEKPSERFFCNAGIYVLSPRVIKKIPVENFLNMTDLIEQCLTDGDNVSVYPLHEYWTDIGTPADLEAARKEFDGN